MDFKMVDMDTFARKKHFDYFKDMAQPYVGLTVKVDITDFLNRVKEKAYPFFLSFLYCVSHAANAVPELRQRIAGGGIIEYAWCPTSHTVALANDTYGYCQLDSSRPFEEYLPYAVAAQERAKSEPSLEDTGDVLSLLFISTLPWVTYESFIQPVPSPADSNPRITWGRYQEQDGQVFLPVSTLCHHALVDGVHLSRFYQRLDRELKRFSGER